MTLNACFMQAFFYLRFFDIAHNGNENALKVELIIRKTVFRHRDDEKKGNKKCSTLINFK
jgi:hypothetical protein